eukprot:Nk52_evm82s1737 gene=Nk52_evmTU82s1737
MHPSNMKVLVIGSGGREHALAWKLAKSQKVSEVLICPGNGGTDMESSKIRNVAISEKDHDGLIFFAKENDVCLAVVGPEQPLVDGITGRFKRVGIPVFGPSEAAAQLEASKAFSKDFMKRQNIPTAEYAVFSDVEQAKNYVSSVNHNVVVKASGLAAGKGVIIPANKEEAVKAVDSIMCDNLFGSSGSEVVIEECLVGEEISVFALTDGYSIVALPASQDHKRAFDGDKGPNTGGMGAYSPVSCVTQKIMDNVYSSVLKPTVDGMRKEGNPYVGLLYAGLMLTKEGPKVLEFNCRFGDPETQVVLPLISDDCDFFDIVDACATGKLDSVPISFKDCSSACVVLASQGYPGSYPKGKKITLPQGLDFQCKIFHAGTKVVDGELQTSGGRVMAVSCIGESLEVALERCYATVGKIDFEGMQYRKDIGQKSLSKKKVGATYADAGVSIDSGNAFVDVIKPLAKSTVRPGCNPDLGGFGGLFDLKQVNYKDPILVSSTDGVGTKLIVAQSVEQHSTIGIDLVAMCVNDLIVQGAEPLFFLDYFATGKLNVQAAADVVSGVAEGCRQANCALVGGETAEMPGMYGPGHYDIAGFTVGVVERDMVLPKNNIGAGDVLIGVPSSGIHSNGYSLVRHLVSESGVSFSDPCPFEAGKTLGEALLTPTRIYVESLMPIIKKSLVKGMAHITGGGFIDNIPRVLDKNTQAIIDCNTWKLPSVFQWMMKVGNIDPFELGRTFNCGVGMVLIADATVANEVLKELEAAGEKAFKIGHLAERPAGAEHVVLENVQNSWSA